MTTDQLLTTLIIGGAVVFLAGWAWRGLRGKSSCNCGCCDEKLQLNKPK